MPMPMVKKDGYGVFEEGKNWWFKTYKSDDPRHGPFPSRTVAMERLLAVIGFDVEQDTAELSAEQTSKNRGAE